MARRPLTLVTSEDRAPLAAVEDGKRQIALTMESALTGRQRQTMQARAALLAYCDGVAQGRGLLIAYEETARAANAGALPPDLQALVPIANDRSGGAHRLSATTLRRWASARKKAGVAGVAPQKSRAREAAPAWMDTFLRYWSRPMKPSLADCLRQWQEDAPATQLPSYSTVRAALDKLSHHERARGREGRLAMRARMAFVKRDASQFEPTLIYAADGTTWDREVEHPIHGRAFKPEITSIIDVHTRMLVGWSAGLSENWQAVADALMMACVNYGVPAIWYTDRGSGYINEKMGAEMTGVISRLHSTPMQALPYHSWSKGNVEAFQKHWIDVAKRAPTYTGRDMDKEARKLAFQTTRREIALVGASKLLTPWPGFLQEIGDFVSRYNARPHRGLPKIRDQETGLKRHLSPNEMWARAVANGFDAITLDDFEAADIFRPYELRTVRRCCVQIGSNSYFDEALDPFHEKQVMVGYDMRDASRVWVRVIDLDKEGKRVPGRLVCIARFEGNAQRYVPVTMERLALERRAQGRMKRLKDHLAVVEAELRPGVVLDGAFRDPANAPHLEIPAPSFGATALGKGVSLPNRGCDQESSREEAASPARSVVSEEVTGFAAAGEAAHTASAVGLDRSAGATNVRPAFTDNASFARWLVSHADEATETDRAFAAELLNDRTERELLRIRGVDCEALRAIAINEAP